MLMLVPGWERAAAPLARWIDNLGKARDNGR
jgi:hypothetical protein